MTEFTPRTPGGPHSSTKLMLQGPPLSLAHTSPESWWILLAILHGNVTRGGNAPAHECTAGWISTSAHTPCPGPHGTWEESLASQEGARCRATVLNTQIQSLRFQRQYGWDAVICGLLFSAFNKARSHSVCSKHCDFDEL